MSLHHVPGTKEQHDADFDFYKYLAGKFGEARHTEVATIEPYLQMFFRAGWEAHKEEMQQEAMSDDGG